MKQVVILAGGKGTRLSSRSAGLPKPMVPILNKPLLQHQVELCVSYGFTDIHMLVAYRHDLIEEFFEDGRRFGASITYHIESTPLGTAGALLDVVDSLSDTFLVIYGDTFIDVSLNKMWEFHKQRESIATIFVHPNDHPHDSDLVDIDEKGLVTQILTYPHPSNNYYRNLVNAALYIIEKSSLIDVYLDEDKPDIAKDLFPLMLKQQKNISGYISCEYIKDMGTPERLDQVELDFKNNVINQFSENNKRTALFLDRDGVINYEVGFLSNISDMELIPGSGSAIRQANKSGMLVVVITNQPVIARGELSEDNLRLIHNKMETLLGNEGAYVDAIYYCPHHPDSGFDGEIKELKTSCECRKPANGMLLEAANDFNVNLEKSWLIGDRTTDIQAANISGIQSVLVETGYAGNDKKCNSTPDFIAADLFNAVQLILGVSNQNIGKVHDSK